MPPVLVVVRISKLIAVGRPVGLQKALIRSRPRCAGLFRQASAARRSRAPFASGAAASARAVAVAFARLIPARTGVSAGGGGKTQAASLARPWLRSAGAIGGRFFRGLHVSKFFAIAAQVRLAFGGSRRLRGLVRRRLRLRRG